jgi:hypothetical protein
MDKAIPEEYLGGLSFNTAVVEGVGKEKKHVPVRCQLEPEDVLDWSETDREVIIVAADGRKHRVQKGAEPSARNLEVDNPDQKAPSIRTPLSEEAARDLLGGALFRDIPLAVVGVTSSDIVWSDVQTAAVGKGKKR